MTKRPAKPAPPAITPEEAERLRQLNAERQRRFRERKATEENATEVRGIFLHPDDHAALKDHAGLLARRRARAARKAGGAK